MTAVENMAEGPTIVRVTFFAGGQRYVEEYADCFAVYVPKTGQTYIRKYGEPPTAIPRAIFPGDVMPVVEHFGSHRAVAVPDQPPAKLVAGTVTETKMAPPSVLPQGDKEEKAWNRFQNSAPSAEEQGQKYLKGGDADPKADPEPSSTEAGSGSVPPLTETPSGRFMTSPPPKHVPTPEYIPGTPLAPTKYLPMEEDHVSPSTLGPDMNTTPAPGAFDNRATRRGRSKGNHSKPRTIPGATVLLATALFLSLLFHRSS